MKQKPQLSKQKISFGNNKRIYSVYWSFIFLNHFKARNKNKTQFLQHCMWKNNSFTTYDFIYIIEIICVHLNALLHFPTADSLFCTF